MKGHKKKKIPHSNHREKMHAMRGSKDLYSRIHGGIGKGSEGSDAIAIFLTLSWKMC